ncbi:hypothetical protein PXK58_21245 [Phaeobacter gallaeciensis]|uniref:hypothetical protein n=1 Tax=Phaeobacter gallaeciensis TaxID=60890 RepID=UPI00238050BE|nr:hypothetical protein [Phaeobacter gallaeciensis]MDE4276815.1 hypothetical protein [Phaeobacter gallaeciensis]MDE4302046.1 hypothetical protein [Phaeobacter gallaeciensis]MDE5187235.1 hypothetical protein [Phaeobacter gallaeciensis]
MKIKAISAVLAAMLTIGPAAAQSLTPEQIAAMVDQKMNELNPYQSLLNDPDPERSRLAMQVMLESGDPELVRMALEFGLLSPSQTVKHAALKAWLGTRPVITMRFDGTAVRDGSYPKTITNSWSGSLDGKIGYWRISVGDYLEEKHCFANTRSPEDCFVTVNVDSIFFTPTYLNGRAIITDEGSLAGKGQMFNVDEQVPFSVKLLN